MDGNTYTVHALLIFSWSVTFWECRIWRADIFCSIRDTGM